MSRFLKHSKVFDDSKGRFFLVLLTEENDARLSKLNLSITDGNTVWKASTSFEEPCGSLNSRREENVKHLIRRISNCRLETCDDTDELSVTLVPPGKTYELKFKKATSASATLERLDLLVAVADAGDLKTLVDSVDNDTMVAAASAKRSKTRKEAAPVEREGMSLLNPRSRKIPTSRELGGHVWLVGAYRSRLCRRRISNCRLETCDDTDELSVTLVPPGKTYELKFKKATSAGATLERLDLLVAVADAGDLKTLVDSVDNETMVAAASAKRSKSLKEAAPLEREGMSLLNPRSRKMPTSRGIDFD